MKYSLRITIMIFLISLLLTCTACWLAYHGQYNYWFYGGITVFVISHLVCAARVWRWGHFITATPNQVIFFCMGMILVSFLLLMLLLYHAFNMSLRDYLIFLACYLALLLAFQNVILFLLMVDFLIVVLYIRHPWIYLLLLTVASVLLSLLHILEVNIAPSRQVRSPWIAPGLLLVACLPAVCTVFLGMFITRTPRLPRIVWPNCLQPLFPASIRVGRPNSQGLISSPGQMPVYPGAPAGPGGHMTRVGQRLAGGAGNPQAHTSQRAPRTAFQEEPAVRMSKSFHFGDMPVMPPISGPLLWVRLEDEYQRPIHLPAQVLFWKTASLSEYYQGQWRIQSSASHYLPASCDGYVHFTLPSGMRIYGRQLVQRFILTKLAPPTLCALYPVERMRLPGLVQDDLGNLELPHQRLKEPLRYTVASRMLRPWGIWRHYLLGHDDVRFLKVPANIRGAKIFRQALRITWHRRRSECLRRVMAYLHTGQYTLQSALARHTDPTLAFLHSKRGYCRHFASAATLLLRAHHIPARVAVGFKGGRWHPQGQYYTIHAQHAHAWVEVHFRHLGWLPFDPTPAVSPDTLSRQLTKQHGVHGSQKSPMSKRASSSKQTGPKQRAGDTRASAKPLPAGPKETSPTRHGNRIATARHPKYPSHWASPASRRRRFAKARNYKRPHLQWRNLTIKRDGHNPINPFEKLWQQSQFMNRPRLGVGPPQNRNHRQPPTVRDHQQVKRQALSSHKLGTAARRLAERSHGSTKPLPGTTDRSLQTRQPVKSHNFEQVWHYLVKCALELGLVLGVIAGIYLLLLLCKRLLDHKNGASPENSASPASTADILPVKPTYEQLALQRRIIKLYLKLLSRLAGLGLERASSQTPYEFANSLDSIFVPPLASNQRTAHFFVRARYSPWSLHSQDLRQARNLFNTLWQEVRKRRTEIKVWQERQVLSS